MQAIQPAQLRITRPIADDIPGCVDVIFREDPTQVRPPETGDVRGVGIVRRVGEAMVLAMVRCPPQWAFLQSATAEAGDEELHHAAGFVGAMSEVAVIAGRNAEHAGEVEDSAENKGGDIDADEQGRQTGQMQTDERHTFQPVGDRRGAGLWGLFA